MIGRIKEQDLLRKLAKSEVPENDFPPGCAGEGDERQKCGASDHDLSRRSATL